MSWLRIGLASLAVSTVMMVPAAAAETFCVHGSGDAPGCGAATQKPTIQAAVDAAAGSAGADVVQLKGTLPAQGFAIGAGNAVDVDGTDADALTITSSDHIEVHEPGASISHVAFVVQTPAPPVTIDLAAGTLSDADIVGAYSSEATIRLGDATLDGVEFEEVEYPGTAVNAVGPGGVIERSALYGQYALKSTADGLAVRNSVLVDKTYAFGGAALSVTRGSATVDDTLVVLDQTGLGFGDGVTVTPAAGETLDLALRSVTVTGTGSDPDVTPPRSTGVVARCSSDATANVSLLDTAVIRFTQDLVDSGCGMSLDHVRYGGRVGETFADGPSVVGGGYPFGWLAAPIYESSLIDAGSDRSDDVHDFQGLPRVVDGNGDGVAQRDIGAWEYQRQPPVAVLADQHVAAEQMAAIDGSASGDPDDGDFGFLSYAWKIDGSPFPYVIDQLETVFTTGTHTVELTVSDPTGLSDTATATITADNGEAPPSPSPSPSPSSPPPAPAPGRPLTPSAVFWRRPLPAPPVTPAQVLRTSAVLLDHRLSKAGKLRVKVTCGGGVAVCRGHIQLRAGEVVLGRSAAVVVFANRPKTVSVTVNAAGRKLLRKHKAKGVVVSVRLYKSLGMSYTQGAGGRIKPAAARGRAAR